MSRKALLVTLALGLASAGVAQAETLFEQAIAPRGIAAPCYARIYDADHLRRYPRQRITLFYLRHSEADASVGGHPHSFEVAFAFGLRRDPDLYGTEGACGGKGLRLRCSVEGDGGSFFIEPAGDGLKVTLGERFSVEFKPNLGEAGSDDRTILLRRSSPALCDYDRMNKRLRAITARSR